MSRVNKALRAHVIRQTQSLALLTLSVRELTSHKKHLELKVNCKGVSYLIRGVV